ncbi:M48 family metallopeptidase [Sinisalibacter aestuarii]|uniref:Peptidase M48 domain-containing protein n=1 Tax=Sinisalibacter aestuarii TaxID=2949426 RepID=A0ABQ5LVT8_9RHOB|nr:M48 family metallopeptidase [Sinisalibacter aestuarii]GKY89004.1 hypothetical protein STA1M1_28730 [Sinisalibacter aestuarii]
MADTSTPRPEATAFADPKSSPMRYRHRWEMPLVALSILISLVVLAVGLVSLIAGLATPDPGAVAETADAAGEDAIDFGSYALLLLAAPLYIFVMRFYQIARDKANAVRVGPEQFPEIWALYQDVARRLGFEAPPRLYIKNGNGVVNAYAMSCNTRAKYVVLHAEIALLMDTSPETVEFVLAHELSHHRLRHVSLLRLVVTFLPRLIPAFGVSQVRAQEYSADRLAHSVCNHHRETISLLMIGPWINHKVDHDALNRQTEEERGEWFIRAANVMSNHAVGVKRYRALQEIDEKGYGAHGDMF